MQRRHDDLSGARTCLDARTAGWVCPPLCNGWDQPQRKPLRLIRGAGPRLAALSDSDPVIRTPIAPRPGRAFGLIR